MKRIGLVANTKGFTINCGDIHREIDEESILRIAAYKVDEITTDLICLDITVNQEEGVQTWTIHEDIDGFDLVLTWLETLPGFSTSWKEDVVFPAFKSNRTIVFQR